MATRYNTAALRDLISAALTEDELTALAFDYFRPVANQFTAGQTRNQRVQLLLEHAERSGQMARLAALIQEIAPARYREYAERLLAPDADATDAAHFLLVEVYRTADAPARHKETTHYAAWRDAVAPMMAAPRSSVKYNHVFPADGGW